MIKITITDEFYMKYTYVVDDPKEASKIVKKWLLAIGETPIYEINITIVEE